MFAFRSFALGVILISLSGLGSATNSLDQRVFGTTATQNSNITTLTPQFFPNLNSQRVKIRYGPYTVPPMSVDNGMADFGEEVAQMPCTDCILTWIQAGLEYPNGTYANVDTGMWLHHTVVYNLAKQSLVCPMPGVPENFFASGNERTAINICLNGTVQAGYYIRDSTQIGLIVELMNMNDMAMDAVLTITYEFIPTVPADFAQVNVLWLDIGGCTGDSEQPAQPDTTFEYSSPIWKSANTTGEIVGIGAHLHDGGTHLVVTKDSQTICDSRAAYGESAAYIDGGSSSMNMSMDMPGMDMSDSMKHISSLSFCTMAGTIVPGDELSITAYYNTSKWMPMTDTNGSLAPIMGISLLYVADTLNVTTTPANNTSGNSSSSSSSSKTNSAAGGMLSQNPWTATVYFCGILGITLATYIGI